MENQQLTIDEELSPRWALFLKEYLEHGNAYQSALTAGFSEEYAKVITSRYPDKVIKSLKDALENKGITATKIASKIGQLLDAEEDGRPNYQAMEKGITHAMKARGDIEEKDPIKNNNNYNFFFSPEVQADVRELEERIKAKLRNAETNQTNVGTE